MKTLPLKYWLLYATLLGLLSATVMELIISRFDSSKLIFYTVPGAVYGFTFYILGVMGNKISAYKERAIALFILPVGSTVAWYTAIKSVELQPFGASMLSLSHMILASIIGAFIVGLLVVVCWKIKNNRSYFFLFITLAGGVLPALWNYIKIIGESFNIDIPNFLFFATWQVTLLIIASLFSATKKY